MGVNTQWLTHLYLNNVQVAHGDNLLCFLLNDDDTSSSIAMANHPQNLFFTIPEED
jgi:hypothetical protein